MVKMKETTKLAIGIIISAIYMLISGDLIYMSIQKSDILTMITGVIGFIWFYATFNYLLNDYKKLSNKEVKK